MDTFIQQAKLVHGDKYDYTNTKYENNLKEVIIQCREHGEFLQLPKSHKRGSGCKNCGIQKCAKAKRSNSHEFIEKAKLIHGDKYDYSKVDYKKAMEKVILICKKHGEFKQTPNGHLSKSTGCQKCSTEINANKARHTTDQFKVDAIKIHGDTYDYSKVDYKKAMEKVIIICKVHGEFEQTPNSHLSKSSGCIKCKGCYKSNTNEFIEKAILIHEDKYDYSEVNYDTVIVPVTILCKMHGAFQQTPGHHLNGAGCFKCGHNQTLFSTKEFIDKAIQIHGDIYEYSNVNYENMTIKVRIVCKIHGVFEQTPSNHITHAQGCQQCAGNYQSNTFEFVEKSKIKHGDRYNY